MTAFDVATSQFFRNLTGKSFAVDWLVVFFAEYFIYVLTALFLLYLFFEKDWRRRLYFFSVAALAAILSRGIMTPLVRLLYEKPRPFAHFGFEPLIGPETTSAFPSGHMAFIVPVFLALWLFHRRAAVWFLVGTLVIGTARISAGVHWPTDIIGGLLVGTLGFLLAYLILKKSAPEGKEKT